MCGRFALHAKIEELVEHFKLSSGFIMKPRYNIAPTQVIPIVTQLHAEIVFSTWSFIPFWAKPIPDKKPKGYINARQETLREKPTFKQAIKSYRCIIPMSGYYEWKTLQGKKQPYYVLPKDKSLIGVAGIWSRWQKNMPQEQITCAVITTDSQGDIKQVHERMPLILDPKEYEVWLNPKSNEAEIDTCLQKTNLPALKVYPVSMQMNAPAFDTPLCIKHL